MTGKHPIDPGYPVIPEERESDLHNLEYVDQAGLILFMAGNQFMLLPELVSAFQNEHPEVHPIAYQTLPPGLELKEILAGGAVFRGKAYPMLPDVYSSVSREAMQVLVDRGMVEPESFFVYLHNKLALMVRQGNPKGIRTVLDLGREDVVVSQPSPEYEHIAEHVAAMYEQAGGQELLRTVLEDKKARGTTLLTTVHHRETPSRILSGEADVGPVWHTELIEAAKAGLEIEGVAVEESLDQSETVRYHAARLRGCRNPDAAVRFLDFLTGRTAQRIFRKFGFIPEPAAE